MNEKRRRRDGGIFGEYFDEGLVQSATDMTGITPTPPLTESEEDSYEALRPDSGFGLRKPDREKKWFDF